MAVDIKSTKTFVNRVAKIARRYHKNNRVAIKTERGIWTHDINAETEIKSCIWCSICGRHFDSFEEFLNLHGGE